MICAICGRSFEPKVYNAKYCSRKCRKKASRLREKSKIVIREDIPDGIPIREFHCRQCGGLVTVKSEKDKRTVFCCKEHEKRYWKHPPKKRRETANQGMSGGMSLNSLIRRERMDLL